MTDQDVIVIGGGIIGLATAYRLTERFPRLNVLLLEKEREVARHQSGRNSGVIHSGIYYPSGSLKAQTCREGKRALEAFCTDQSIPFEICGKVIVAVDDSEIPALERIHDRGRQNGVQCELIDGRRLKELEPHARCVRAIHVPEAGIVDFAQVCQRLHDILVRRGVRAIMGAKVNRVATVGNRVVVEDAHGAHRARCAVNCAGLYSDQLARQSGGGGSVKIIPFRGEYYLLSPGASKLCRNLIYPVPDPRFPFLGVHVTRMIDGRVECGPNAVLALAREGYRWRDVNLAELADALLYRGMWIVAARYWRTGLLETVRSISKSAFLRAVRRLIPEIPSDALVARRSGVRAQAVSPSGQLVDDFVITESGRCLHVQNAPSPAATAALEIGRRLVDRLARRIEGD